MAIDLRNSGFLGFWRLMPGTCVYEQGDPPTDGSYDIELAHKTLRFTASWTDADGGSQHVTFSGPANGVAMPFAGGSLADALSIELVSERQLDSTAWKDGTALMFAKRTLSDSGRQMTISQTVRLPDGSSPTNWSTYERVQKN